jgi:hypothetical protein
MDEIPNFFQINFPFFFQKWIAAIVNPGQFLSRSFAPTDEQLADGLKFYLAVAAASLFIYGLITIFVERGSLAIKARMLANGLLGIILLFVAAMAAYFPIWLLGGKGSFSGTLLAYIYAGTPYAPLMAVASWIFVAGMPPRLRRYALNPATGQELGQIAAQDPDTDKVTFYIGSLIVTGLVVWSLYLVIRWLSFVQDLGGWRLAVAIILWFAILFPINLIFRRMASLMYDDSKGAYAVQDGGGDDT